MRRSELELLKKMVNRLSKFIQAWWHSEGDSCRVFVIGLPRVFWLLSNWIVAHIGSNAIKGQQTCGVFAFGISLDPINHLDPLGQLNHPDLSGSKIFTLFSASGGVWRSIILFGGIFLWYWPWFGAFVTRENSTRRVSVKRRYIDRTAANKGSTVRWQHYDWVMLAIGGLVNASKDGCHAMSSN